MSLVQTRALQPLSLSPLDSAPLVSVVLANYNYAHYLNDAVESVIDQSYPNWELIVCDDGSTDDSREIATRWAEQEPRIRVLLKSNGGQVSAWNHAYDHCRGDIICFLDSDDAFSSGKLEAVVSRFLERPNAGLVYHRFRFAHDDLTPTELTGPDELPDGWLPELSFQRGQAFASKTSDFAVRREILDELIPLPEELPFADGYIYRIATFLTEVAPVPDVLSLYRIHGTNAMGNVTLLEPRTLAPMLSLIRRSFGLEQQFLRERFGDEAVERRKLDRLTHFWRAAGALYVLEGKPSQGIEGYSPDEILRILSESSQRYLWRLLFALPAPVSRRLLHMWWSEASWKPLVRPIAGFLGLRERQGA